MKRYLLLAGAVLTVALLISGSLTAQQQSTRIVLIDSLRVFEAHPQGGTIAERVVQSETELAGLQADIEDLVARLQGAGREATFEERQQYDLLMRSYTETSERWAREIELATAPISEEITALVAQVAQQSGYHMVWDARIAAMSGLVIYADDNVDVTEQLLDHFGQ